MDFSRTFRPGDYDVLVLIHPLDVYRDENHHWCGTAAFPYRATSTNGARGHIVHRSQTVMPPERPRCVFCRNVSASLVCLTTAGTRITPAPGGVCLGEQKHSPCGLAKEAEHSWAIFSAVGPCLRTTLLLSSLRCARSNLVARHCTIRAAYPLMACNEEPRRGSKCLQSLTR